MSVIVFDGPEKAGKSTIIEALRQYAKSTKFFDRVYVRHWGPVSPDDRVYAHELSQDSTCFNELVIWDRCWPSEYVYGNLLGRSRRGTGDPWLLEWLHGRAVQSNGVRVMILGPDVKTLKANRDESDLKVDPARERQLYQLYAERFGWLMFENEHSDAGVKKVLDGILTEFDRTKTMDSRKFCGNLNADVVFVGDKRSEKALSGGWLPFTSRMTSIYGRLLDDYAFKCAWTNASECPPVRLKDIDTIVACGEKAKLWVENYVPNGKNRRILALPHPSYLYRFNSETVKSKRESVEQIIRNLVKE